MTTVLCHTSLCIITLLSLGESGEEVLYGTQNGRVGLVQVGPDEPLYRWDLDNEKREGGEERWEVGSGVKWSSESSEMSLRTQLSASQREVIIA